MATRRLKPDEVAADIRKQQEHLVSKKSRKKFHSKVVGPVMVTGVIMRFLTGKGPDGQEWKSGAAATKLGGRYSEAYDKRPSGRAVSAGSIRNTDTGALANSHTVKTVTHSNVKVGPSIKGKDGNAIKIMEREAGYGNFAVGWDNALLRVLDSEKQAYINEIAMGKVPRYLPKSRIRKRV